MLYEDRWRATSFGSQPELYHRTRPSYPLAAVDALMADAPVDVLDVGCGTGIVGALFRDRGCRVLGVEVDDRMASYARGLGLEVETARFEDWDSRGRRYELLVSGQAWHWVDPRLGAARAAEVIRPGGRIGLLWNRARHPAGILARFERIYSEMAPSLLPRSIVLGREVADRFDSAAAGLDRTGAFGPVVRSVFGWEAIYSTARWRDHLITHSDHQALGPERMARLIDAVTAVVEDLGGSFQTAYETVLVTACRL